MTVDAGQQTSLRPAGDSIEPVAHLMRRSRYTTAVGDGIRNLSPGYFALVMATGIISIALAALGATTLSGVMFAVNIVAYSVLVVLFVARAACFGRRFVADLLDHRTGPGFFTAVAHPASSAASACGSPTI